MAALRARLATALRTEFERAQEQSGQRLADAVAPYARFVRAEERRWSEAQRTLTALRDRTAAFLAHESPAPADDAPGSYRGPAGGQVGKDRECQEIGANRAVRRP